MSDSSEILRRKFRRSGDLQAVVRTMKALAASRIEQFERSVAALDDYYRTVELGLGACFRRTGMVNLRPASSPRKVALKIGAVVFGSDQGLVGQFNESLIQFAVAGIKSAPEATWVMAMGERAAVGLADEGFLPTQLFNVPASVEAVAPLVGQILIQIDALRAEGEIGEVHLFYNRHIKGASYEPARQKLLPLDEHWLRLLADVPWPTRNLPEVMGEGTATLRALLHEHLFISLFRACANSLASENASRLAAMQRADRNIEELLEHLEEALHRQRQSAIDEELFDVLAGFEAASD